MNLQETLAAIEPMDQAIAETIEKGWENRTQYGSYGKLVQMVAQYGAATRQVMPEAPKPCMVIAVGDHGVVEMGVSAYPKEVTQHMTMNYLIPKGAAANALGNYCGAAMEVVDIGIDGDMGDLPGLRKWKVAHGTKNFLYGPAMTKEECTEAIEKGIALVQEKCAQGYNVFLVGEMGISNTTAAALMTAKFAGLTADEATGRGSNISDKRLKVKQKVVHDTLVRHEGISKDDGFEILRCLGGFEFAFITGVILGAAAERAVTVIDGFNTTACALVANSLQPHAMDYVMASHLSAEKAHMRSLKTLGLASYVDLGLCLGEATGGSIQMEMLNLAVEMYRNMDEVDPFPSAKGPQGPRKLQEEGGTHA